MVSFGTIFAEDQSEVIPGTSYGHGPFSSTLVLDPSDASTFNN
jgi:hypothetical protein